MGYTHIVTIANYSCTWPCINAHCTLNKCLQYINQWYMYAVRVYTTFIVKTGLFVCDAKNTVTTILYKNVVRSSFMLVLLVHEFGVLPFVNCCSSGFMSSLNVYPAESWARIFKWLRSPGIDSARLGIYS